MLRVGFIIAVVLTALLGRAERLPQMDGQPFFPPSHLKRLPYFEQTILDAYRTVGSRDPRWNHYAESALAIYARFLCFDQVVCGTTNFQLMLNSFKAAREAGCDDPMLAEAALQLRERGLAAEPPPAQKDYRPVIEALQQHAYPPSRQGWIYAHAAQAALRAAPDPAGLPLPANLGQARAWSEAGLRKLAEAVALRADREDLYLLAPQLFSAYLGAAGDLKPALDLFQAALVQRSAVSNEVALVICAGGLLQWAGDAQRVRSRLSAETNQVLRRELMGEMVDRVASAERLLTNAWALDQTDAFVCKEMLTVLAPQLDRPNEFQQWFERGRKADPACYAVYSARLDYLLTRYHGRQQALAFGHACLQEGNWLEQIPFILLDAHQKLVRSREEQPAEAWNDLQLIHESYLRLYPANNLVRSSYAYCAYTAQRWDLLRALLQQLGDLAVPGVFRGHYQECREALHLHPPSQSPTK